MPFILSPQRHGDVVQAFAAYQKYIAENKSRFPPGALQLATSDWYYNFDDHRCPHDAWLEKFELSETGSGSRQQIRQTSLQIQLLSAYHDGHIQLRYPRIYAFDLGRADSDNGLGDWRYDEFRLHPNGHLIHEIEWIGNGHPATWIIEASDIEFTWTPIPTPN